MRARCKAEVVYAVVAACGEPASADRPRASPGEPQKPAPTEALATPPGITSSADDRRAAAGRAWLGLPPGYVSRAVGRHQLHAPSDVDTDDAAAELVHASTAFAHHFEHEPRAIHVIVFPSADEMLASGVPALQRDAQPVMPWFTATAFAAGDAGLAAGAELEGALSHEAGHLFVKMLVDTHMPVDRALLARLPRDTYGHALAPDWLDEAGALVSERPDLQRFHLEALATQPELWPLSAVFAMQHPIAAPVSDALTARARTGAQVDGPVVLSIADPHLHAETLLFYAHCLSFAQFLETSAGPGALGRVTARLMSGESADVAVAKEVGDAQVEQLERRWQHWGKHR